MEKAEHTALGEFWNNLRMAPRRMYEVTFRSGVPKTDRTRSTFIFGNVFLHLAFRPDTPLVASLVDDDGPRHHDDGRVSDNAYHRRSADVLLQALPGRSLPIHQGHSLCSADGPVHTQHPPMGGECNGRHRDPAHGARVLHGGLSQTSRIQLADRHGDCWWLRSLFHSPATCCPGTSSRTGQLPSEPTSHNRHARSPTRWGSQQWLDTGGLQRELLLGSDKVGEEALIRFYLLHVMILPIGSRC